MLVNPEELEKSYKENKENISEALKKRREAEKYRNFKQLLNAFYGKEESLQEESIKLEDTANIKIEPKILYNSFYKTLHVLTSNIVRRCTHNRSAKGIYRIIVFCITIIEL